MRKLIFGAALLAAASSASIQAMDNPFLSEYRTIYQIPPFEQIRYEHYLPALEAGIAEQKSNVDGITANREAATFENTILALENSAPILDRVTTVFFNLTESNASPEFDEISATFIPRYSQHSDDVMMNDALFARVKAVYDKRDALDSDQRRLVEDYYNASPARRASRPRTEGRAQRNKHPSCRPFPQIQQNSSTPQTRLRL